MLNNDLFVRKPLESNIPNDGVTAVSWPTNDKEWGVLEYELSSFVCEGEYKEGLEKILDSYNKHVSRTTQPAVWVSGFYGSGKSHLVRVLEHLWVNTMLPNGATARGEVTLTAGVSDAVKEFTTVATRFGPPPFAAAGVLDVGGDSLNAIVLSIVLRSAKLPPQIGPAKVALWLESQGILEAVKAHLEAQGIDSLKAIGEYHLSRQLWGAILEAAPDLASDTKEVRTMLRAQFPVEQRALSANETAVFLREILMYVGNGKIPATLIVLDEVQQYVSENSARANEIQNLTEELSKSFDGRVLLVGTGQQELTQDPALAKIQDRFTVKVTLKNKDLDTVIRSVELRKNPTGLEELRLKLNDVAGEISRQLRSTKAQETAGDDAVRDLDYPLLPGRRRFWEAVLRQADLGRAGQLRSQLRIIHEANRAVAEKPVGTVIGADYLYRAKNDDLNASGILSRDTQRLIDEQGPEKGRILGLIALIDILRPIFDTNADLGIRSKEEHIADLLIEDLEHDGTRWRQKLPGLLSKLVEDGILQHDNDEYRIQTPQGKIWSDTYRKYYALFAPPNTDVPRKRDAALRAALAAELPPRIMQGQAKVPRTIKLFTEDSFPQPGNEIVVWLRSGWEGVTPNQFDDQARQLGPESPTILLYLPRANQEALDTAIRQQEAAQATINDQGAPADEEGKQARSAMDSRLRAADSEVRRLVREDLAQARIQLGGGRLIEGNSLRERIDKAAEAAAKRQFTKFDAADGARWGQVITRIKEDSPDPLKILTYDGDALAHPVVKSALEQITASGTSGAKITESLGGAPYGWPDDAIKSALAVLVANGQISASSNASPVGAAAVAALTRIGQVNFKRESTTISPMQRIRAAQLLAQLGAKNASKDALPTEIENLVSSLAARASAVSGVPPLPEVRIPSEVVASIRGTSGNDKIVAFLDAFTEINQFAERLDQYQSLKPGREQALATARSMATAASPLPEAQNALSQLYSLNQSRDLLSDVDPITPILADLTAVLRNAINERYGQWVKAHAAVIASLDAQPEWRQIQDAARAQLLTGAQLGDQPAPAVGTGAEVLAALRQRPLDAWQDATDALAARAEKVRLAAIELAHPTPPAPNPDDHGISVNDGIANQPPQRKVIRLVRKTLHTVADLESYLTAIRLQAIATLQNGGVVEVEAE